MRQPTPIPALWFLRAIENHNECETIDAGLEAAVRQYYADYIDAGCLDYEFDQALRELARYGVEDIDELIERVETDIASESGRTFTRETA